MCLLVYLDTGRLEVQRLRSVGQSREISCHRWYAVVPQYILECCTKVRLRLVGAPRSWLRIRGTWGNIVRFLTMTTLMPHETSGSRCYVISPARLYPGWLVSMPANTCSVSTTSPVEPQWSRTNAMKAVEGGKPTVVERVSDTLQSRPLDALVVNTNSLDTGCSMWGLWMICSWFILPSAVGVRHCHCDTFSVSCWSVSVAKGECLRATLATMSWQLYTRASYLWTISCLGVSRQQSFAKEVWELIEAIISQSSSIMHTAR